MSYCKKTLLFLSICTIAHPTFAGNSGTDLNLSAHAIAGSMGGAAYTKPQEPSAAIFGNPATLSQFKQAEYNFGATLLHISELKNTQSTTLIGMGENGNDLNFSNDSVSSADNYVLPNFGSVKPVSSNLTFGYGLEVDAGIGADFRADPITLLGGAGAALVGSQISLPLNIELISLNANLAAAYQVTPELSIGISATIGFGLAQLGTTGDTHGLDQLGGALGGAVADFGGTTSSVHDTAFAASIGATYLLPSGLGFSAAYKSSLDYEFENIVYADTLNFNGSQTMNIEQPSEFIAGFALDNVLADNLLIEFDAIWKDWSDANSYQDIYDDQMLYTLGIQFSDVFPGVDFRLGYSYAENPLLATPNNTISNLQGVGSLPLGASSEALGLSILAEDITKIVQMTLAPVVWQHTFSGGVGYAIDENTSINAFISVASGEEEQRNLTNVDGILASLGVNAATAQKATLDDEVLMGLSIQVKFP